MLCVVLVAAAYSNSGSNEVADIIRAYTPIRRHPDLFDGLTGWTKFLDPDLLAALNAYTESGLRNATSLRELLREEVPGVYSFPILSTEFCDMLLEELDNFYASGLPQHRPNSMNNYGIIVNNIGLRQALDHLQSLVLWPIANILFGAQSKGGFDDHHSVRDGSKPSPRFRPLPAPRASNGPMPAARARAVHGQVQGRRGPRPRHAHRRLGCHIQHLPREELHGCGPDYMR